MNRSRLSAVCKTRTNPIYKDPYQPDIEMNTYATITEA